MFNFSQESSLFRSSFEAMPTNAMICDIATMNITYANTASIETLTSIEHALPVKAKELVGSSIDVFHKNPEHQRKMLSDPANLPHRARITIGGEILDLYVTALHHNGKYVAALLTWELVTKQVAQENETARLLNMLDNMPINVMMADPKTAEITYANSTTIDTLASIEQHLPVKARDLVGTSIDVFHKNPGHQRAIIADASRLPWKTKIKVGPETLDLNVAAVRGPDGSHVTTMLSWSIVTKIVQLGDTFENDVKGAVSAFVSETAKLAETSDILVANMNNTSEKTSGVATATEQLAASINEIASQVTVVERSSRDASEQAGLSANSVDELSSSATKIGEVVGLISDIAAKTNLLALNATIEAARAGEAGRGFAVVAQEVKSLAEQTGKATDTIGEQIRSIQARTDEVVNAMKGVMNSIDQMSAVASTVAAAVEEQQAATANVSSTIQMISDSTQQSTDHVGGLKHTVVEFENRSNLLNERVDEFLHSVRAM